MPKVKISRKSTDTDMTPFVDIAFLILSFFIMATKMKAPEPVKTEPPNSVATKVLPATESILITMDATNRVFYTIQSENDKTPFVKVIEELNTSRNLGLTEAEKAAFTRTITVGVPFSQLKSYLNMSAADQAKINQPGIPITDSLNNELVWWVAASKKAFAGGKMKILIKGDSGAQYPTFEAVIDALKRNDETKYFLVTAMEEAPSGTDLYRERRGQSAPAPGK